jgi:hypothetical protein
MNPSDQLGNCIAVCGCMDWHKLEHNSVSRSILFGRSYSRVSPIYQGTHYLQPHYPGRCEIVEGCCDGIKAPEIIIKFLYLLFSLLFLVFIFHRLLRSPFLLFSAFVFVFGFYSPHNFLLLLIKFITSYFATINIPTISLSSQLSFFFSLVICVAHTTRLSVSRIV